MGIASMAVLSFAGRSGAQDSQPAASQPAGKAQLKPGDKAPDFVAAYPRAQGGVDQQQLSLQEFRGKKNVLLAFYPKADTPGCTTQMCGYRDDWSTFQDNETEVIAISADQQPASDKFRQKYNLPMVVLGDPERSIIKDYGVTLRQPSNNAQRSVVLVDKQGVVQYVDYDYNIQKDKEPLYAKIKELNEEKS